MSFSNKLLNFFDPNIIPMALNKDIVPYLINLLHTCLCMVPLEEENAYSTVPKYTVLTSGLYNFGFMKYFSNSFLKYNHP